jgi:hypothetical protein
LYSCDDDTSTLDNTSEIECIGFTNEELATVGTLHNQYVTEVYQKVDFLNCNDCSGEVIEVFAEIELDLTGVDKSKEELIEEAKVLYQDLEAIQFDLRNWTDHQFSSEAFVHLTTIMAEMDAMESYDAFVADMIQLQTVVDSDGSLTCFDVELLTGTIEVAKNSAFLWLPRNLGGLDYYSISHPNQAQPRWNWGKSLRADVASSAGYFLRLGGAAALGVVPGTNAVILGGWAFTAGFASALGGLF